MTPASPIATRDVDVGPDRDVWARRCGKATAELQRAIAAGDPGEILKRLEAVREFLGELSAGEGLVGDDVALDALEATVDAAAAALRAGAGRVT